MAGSKTPPPDLPTPHIPVPIPVEDPLGPTGPVTDRTRMLPAPSGLHRPAVPRFEIPPPQPMSTMPPPGAVASTIASVPARAPDDA